jgi:hypothetical protein
MNAPRELILLSPYRLPGKYALMIGVDDMAAILNGYSALWHPAALLGATGPPRIASPYDHEQPTAGHLYALPETPPLMLPDDWDQRVQEVGARAFRATTERTTTHSALGEALRQIDTAAPWLDLPVDLVRPFLGIGLGYAVIETLFEAMEHENLLSSSDLWNDVSAALAALNGPDPAAESRRHLQAAAERLLSAREVLYPVAVHLLDLHIVDGDWPHLPQDGAANVITTSTRLERLQREQPEQLQRLQTQVAGDVWEVACGGVLEREDALLPVESQLWNLAKAVTSAAALLGREPRVFARKRFAAHPQLPLFLNSVGLTKAVVVPFDEASLPGHRAVVTNWPSPDGKQIEALTRKPLPAEQTQTFFHLAHHLHQTIMQDQAATLVLAHTGGNAAPWYDDWRELSRLAPALGQWTTLSRFLGDVTTGDYASPAGADEFHGDYLTERTEAHRSRPVSWFARHARARRQVDAGWTLAALQRGLAGNRDPLRLEGQLAELEDRLESAVDDPLDDTGELSTQLHKLQNEVTSALAARLLSRATGNQSGFLLLNPCGFTRRAAVELEGVAELPTPAGPLKASQKDADKLRLVVEVPPLGFAWVPRAANGEAPPPARRVPLADQRCVRNEFFEAEVDPATGGLRAIRDHRSRANRLGQQLVYNPGSSTRATAVRVESTGPALGEIVSEGEILDEQDQVLARFRQRFRAWLGRPLLEMRIEIEPIHAPVGYPWHAYYGARFAWRDERATLLRGVNGTGYVTSHTRPETPDFLEIRLGRQSTTLFPGGLPFHQRQGGRMVDVILVPEGETAQVFDLAIGLDREHPMQTAIGLISPMPVLAVDKGPPHIGAAGWLFHLDAPNLLLTSLRPAAEGADAITARLIECAAYPTQAELRCVRNPTRASLCDARGRELSAITVLGDAVQLDAPGGDLVHVRVEFS